MEAKDEYKKGLWTKEEDRILLEYVRAHGRGHWNRIPRITELKRSGKSCRLRWMNYLSPNVKRGNFSDQEEDLIIRLHNLLGNRWSLIAGRVPGRTDNQVKNYWNSHLCKKLGIKKQTPAARSGLKSETKTTHHHHQHHNSSAQMDSNPKHSDQSCCSSTGVSATVKAAMELDVENDDNPISVHVGDDSYIDQDIQWMTKHCADDSLSWSTHHPILSSWGMMQILDAYPPDLL